MIRLLIAAVLLATSVSVAADGRSVLRVPFLETAPAIDDFLEMEPSPAFEGRMARVEGFVQRDPADGQPASQRTVVYLGYDRQHLYAVFCAFDGEPDRVRAHMSRRENVQGDEIVEVQLDTFDDARTAYTFIANPLGVQWDAIYTEDREFDESWDAVWHSRGRLTDRGYVVWISIPFRSLRFPRMDVQTWGVILVRDIPRNNESSFWPRVTNRVEGRLRQAARLEGIRDVSPGRNVQLIPYATARSFRVLDEPRGAFREDDLDPDAGLDAKMVIADSLALDLTVNPDFSQVESDEPQVTVNERFEVFFPEKRPFFLENLQLFATPIDLLFTRRIADPRLGARLTGKLGKFGLGAFATDDEAPAERAKIGVLRATRDVGEQSTVGVMATHRELGGRRNDVAALDARVKLSDQWVALLQSARSDTREQDGTSRSDFAHDLAANREGRHFTSHIHYREFGPDFRTDLGFVPRVDIRESHAYFGYLLRPEGRRLVSWGPGVFVQYIDDHEGLRLDRGVEPEIEFELQRQTRLGLFGRAADERLRPGDVPGVSEPLDFSTAELGGFFRTRFVDAVDFEVSWAQGRGINFGPPAGEAPFAADTRRAEALLSLRPLRRLRIDGAYLYTRLADRAGRGEVFTNEIARTRFNWQFDRRLSLRAILQYELTRPDPALTSLERDETLNGDLLLTYLVNPWTALYVGYNSNYRNLARVPGATAPPFFERGRNLDFHDGEQVFVKFSYLIGL